MFYEAYLLAALSLFICRKLTKNLHISGLFCLQQPDWRSMCAGRYDVSPACN